MIKALEIQQFIVCQSQEQDGTIVQQVFSKDGKCIFQESIPPQNKDIGEQDENS
jgi:hypothetical protein